MLRLIEEIFAIIIGFFWHFGELFVSVLKRPEAWFLLVLFMLSIGAVFAYASPDISFLGIPGVVYLGDLLRADPSVVATHLMTSLLTLILSLWWLWIFFPLHSMANDLWIHWRQEIFKRSTKWLLLELKMPRLVTQTPEAMDQVFSSLHTLRNAAGNLNEVYVDGEVTRWFTFDMVSFGGEVHFYLQIYAKTRDLVESAFFSYYPDVEVVEVPDFMDKLPKTVGETYLKGMDLWGSEMSLSKVDAYPIKMYRQFETPDPEKRLDPMSSFLELMGKVKPSEFVGIQYLLAPADKGWFKKYDALIKKLKKPEDDKMDEKSGKFSFNMRTPGETEVLEAVERNLSKPAFDTIIRFIYFSPKETYLDTFPRRGITGAFNQYGMLDLNSFGRNEEMSTRAQIWDYPHIFPKVRTELKKQRLLDLYRRREVPPETYWGKWFMSYTYMSGHSSKWFKLNTEALATLLHPPTEFVLTAPHIKRMESKKAAAPAGLAIFGEEELIDKYYPDKK